MEEICPTKCRFLQKTRYGTSQKTALSGSAAFNPFLKKERSFEMQIICGPTKLAEIINTQVQLLIYKQHRNVLKLTMKVGTPTAKEIVSEEHLIYSPVWNVSSILFVWYQ
jgi:hypothetical protein